MTGDVRGQAYTLEAVVGAVLILSAVVIALQTVTVLPTTGGSVDAGVQQNSHQQANDVLAITAQNEQRDLSWYVRYWDESRGTFYGANNTAVGYGGTTPPDPLGETLDRGFQQQGQTYNVNLRYLVDEPGTPDSLEREETVFVNRGRPSDDAVVATYRVTLFDNETLTSPVKATASVPLAELDSNPDSSYPIPNAIDGKVYNVVEVRLVVW